MSDEINQVPPRQVPPQRVPPKRINWRPIGLTLLAAVVLGAGSCFGAIISGGKTLSAIFSAIFMVCVLAFVVGLIWGVVVRIKSL
jgi:hypothetical protein